MPNNQFICNFCLLFLVITLGSIHCHGYFIVDPKGNENVYEKSRLAKQWEKGKRVFAVYDNFNHPYPKNGQEPLIFPASDKFVPADLIDCNIPVYNILRYPLIVDYSISDLFYANLKLKMMQEEYGELQKRAQELSSRDTGQEREEHFTENRGERTARNLNNGSEDDSESEKESIQEIRNRLKKESNSIIRYTLVSYEEELEDMESVNEEEETPVLDHLPFPFRNRPSSEDSLENNKKETAFNAGGSNKLNAKEQYTLNNSKGSPLISAQNETSTVSNLLTIPKKIFRYFVGNRFEALLFGALVLFLILIATSLGPGQQSEATE